MKVDIVHFYTRRYYFIQYNLLKLLFFYSKPNNMKMIQYYCCIIYLFKKINSFFLNKFWILKLKKLPLNFFKFKKKGF